MFFSSSMKTQEPLNLLDNCLQALVHLLKVEEESEQARDVRGEMELRRSSEEDRFS
jgi:hypothetical protein